VDFLPKLEMRSQINSGVRLDCYWREVHSIIIIICYDKTFVSYFIMCNYLC
jgi:hypothetical protein